MKKSKIIKKQDVILIIILLLLSVLIYGIFTLNSGQGAQAAIYVDGECIKKLPLTKNSEYRVKTLAGYNVIVIKDQEVFVKEADCRDKICVNQKAISKKGQTIVCLPHKVIVKIEGGEESEVDGVSG